VRARPRARAGLRILPGAVPGREVAAAPWIPDASLVDDGGLVAPPIVGAALDCPSWFGHHCFHPWNEGGVLLGRLAAHVGSRPHAGERCVTIGWSLGGDGRKLTTGSALFGEDRGLLAFARATWIALK
jgi:hypothetical protein